MSVQDGLKSLADATAAGVAIGSIIKWLPPLAALFTIIWTGIRIIETDTAKSIIAWVRKSPKDKP